MPGFERYTDLKEMHRHEQFNAAMKKHSKTQNPKVYHPESESFKNTQNEYPKVKKTEWTKEDQMLEDSLWDE
jgi:hypothetical protein